MTTARQLADRVHTAWLSAHPFAASSYGIPGYEHLVPDDSEEADEARRLELEAMLAEAERLERSDPSGQDVVTLGCVSEAVRQELAGIEIAAIEHTVTPKPYSGPALLFAVAARTVLLDEAAAGDYLHRLRDSGAFVDHQAERLRAGAAKTPYGS
jgi:uncharacterized protein (DUF885 family)